MTSEFINPSNVLNGLELRENMTAADFGSGSGSWVIPLAKILKKGKVYAIDIQEEPLSALKSRANLEKIFNIIAKRTDVDRKEGSGLPANSVDLVLMTNLLFQLENKNEVFEEAKRVLKQKGKILVVDWEEQALQGPENRVLKEELKLTAGEIGFKIKKEFKAGVSHWALIFEKS